MEEKSRAGDYLLMGALGLFAIAIIAVVIVSMTKKPKLNDDTEKPATKSVEPSSLKLDPTETDSDPQGRFSLDDARRAVPGQGGFVATIRTSKGDLVCPLYDERAPNTVANFIGLATGARAWKDPKTSKWVHRPAYDGTPFHRVIKGFMIQGGDPLGNGTGEPGYTINDEIWPGARHDRAGLLSMANRGPNTNGAQFFIQDAPAAHLDNSYTIFGDCSPIETIHEIANGPVTGDRPTSPVVIESVRIRRAN